MHAILPQIICRSELINADVIAILSHAQFMELINADDLSVESETRVFEMVEMRAKAHSSDLAECYKVGMQI